MKQFSLLVCAVGLALTACKNANTPTQGPAGVQGVKGDNGAPGQQGVKGDTGPQGESGAAGICDLNSCPKTLSVEGLNGGTINGAVAMSSVTVSSSITLSTPTTQTPRGILIVRGDYQTTLNGFYCGKTSYDVDGSAYNIKDMGKPNNDQFGSWVAKKHCEAACNDKAAHPCSVSEIMTSQSLRGGNPITDSMESRNLYVPMPTAGNKGWIASHDGTNSCETFYRNSSSYKGTVFEMVSGGGHIFQDTCDKQYPLLCCL